jgi:hypothetical protein
MPYDDDDTYYDDRKMVVTYGATSRMPGDPETISLCDYHDTADRRVGFAQVAHGAHWGYCSVCATPSPVEA